MPVTTPGPPPSRGRLREPLMIDVGAEICGSLPSAESRDWLCTNGIGGFA